MSYSKFLAEAAKEVGKTVRMAWNIEWSTGIGRSNFWTIMTGSILFFGILIYNVLFSFSLRSSDSVLQNYLIDKTT